MNNSGEAYLFEHQDFLKKLIETKEPLVRMVIEEASLEQLAAIVYCVDYYYKQTEVCGKKDNCLKSLFMCVTSKCGFRKITDEDTPIVKPNCVINFFVKYFDCLRPILCVALGKVLEESFVCLTSCI